MFLREALIETVLTVRLQYRAANFCGVPVIVEIPTLSIAAMIHTSAGLPIGEGLTGTEPEWDFDLESRRKSLATSHIMNDASGVFTMSALQPGFTALSTHPGRRTAT
jgi:hypothetical protein